MRAIIVNYSCDLNINEMTFVEYLLSWKLVNEFSSVCKFIDSSQIIIHADTDFSNRSEVTFLSKHLRLTLCVCVEAIETLFCDNTDSRMTWNRILTLTESWLWSQSDHLRESWNNSINRQEKKLRSHDESVKIEKLFMYFNDSRFSMTRLHREHNDCRCYFCVATINAFIALQMCYMCTTLTSSSFEDARFLSATRSSESLRFTKEISF